MSETPTDLMLVRLMMAGHQDAAFRIQQLTAINAAMEDGMAKMEDIAQTMVAKVATERDALAARVRELEAALEFYADRSLDGYDVQVTDYGLSTERGAILQDGGDIARTALGDSQAPQGGV